MLELNNVSWIGIYAKPWNRYAVFVQLVVFPILLMILIEIKSQQLKEIIFVWILCLVLLRINIFNYTVVGKIRKAILWN